MKLPKCLQIKETLSLYSNKYQYKVVIISPVAHWFRNKELEKAKKRLSEITDINKVATWVRLRSLDDVSYAVKVCDCLLDLDSEFNLRVESPFVNFYTNDTKAVETLANIDPDQIKYITMPGKGVPALVQNTVVVKKLDYDFKVTMGSARRDHKEFINWAENNPNIKLTKKCKQDMSRTKSWGGSYFYVKGDKVLTMARMFLGGDISKVETVIKG